MTPMGGLEDAKTVRAVLPAVLPAAGRASEREREREREREQESERARERRGGAAIIRTCPADPDSRGARNFSL